jgi:hypothetical protein
MALNAYMSNEELYKLPNEQRQQVHALREKIKLENFNRMISKLSGVKNIDGLKVSFSNIPSSSKVFNQNVKDGSPVININGRITISANINGVSIPFYISTGGGGKKNVDGRASPPSVIDGVSRSSGQSSPSSGDAAAAAGNNNTTALLPAAQTHNGNTSPFMFLDETMIAAMIAGAPNTVILPGSLTSQATNSSSLGVGGGSGEEERIERQQAPASTGVSDVVVVVNQLEVGFVLFVYFLRL